MEGDDTLVVEEMRFVRMHAQLSYELLKDRGYSDFILQAILYHHENMDGSGYRIIFPGRRFLRGEDSADLRLYSALTSDRPYRRAFDRDTAVELMIDEIKNFDMEIFIAFLRVVHDHPQRVIHLESIEGIIEGELRQ